MGTGVVSNDTACRLGDEFGLCPERVAQHGEEAVGCDWRDQLASGEEWCRSDGGSGAYFVVIIVEGVIEGLN